MSLANVPVAPEEILARAIHTPRHVKWNGTTRVPKADAFFPYKHVEASVIRHRDLSVEERWQVLRGIAEAKGKPLIGSGDFVAAAALQLDLSVEPQEDEDSPKNHANVTGWPPEKQEQIVIALKIAASATFSTPPA